jgi:membrane protease YdiL (CAAX protease family)
MNIEENEIMNPIKLAFFTAITTFIGAYAWMILLHVVVEIYESTKHGSKTIGKSVSVQMFNNNTILIIISYVVLEIIMLLIACYMVKRHKQDKLELEDIGMKLDNNSFKKIACGFGIASVMYGLIYSAMHVFGIVSFKGYGFSNQSLFNDIGTVILIFFATAVPGFCEEIVFRGVIQNYLMKKMNLPLALIISSAIFSLMHIGRYNDLWTLLSIIVIGVVFGYIFAKTKSLYISIGIHFAWDFLGSLIGVGKSMFNTNYLLIFQNAKNGYDLSNLVIIIVYLLLFFTMYVKYKMNEGKYDKNLKAN